MCFTYLYTGISKLTLVYEVVGYLIKYSLHVAFLTLRL